MTVSQHDRSRPLSRPDRHIVTNRLLSGPALSEDESRREEAIHDAVVLNMPVAQGVASRYRNRGVPLEDLEQVAYAALLRAARNFDPTQADDFLSYAVPSMRGELRKYFRDLAWAVRPPRRVQEIQTRVLDTERELEGRLARHPTAQDIADVLGEKVSDVEEALLCQGCFTPASLETPVGADGVTLLQDRLTSEADAGAFHRTELRVVLAPVLGRLQDRDRRILQLRFVEDLTQQEIADELGITQMQVSRLLSRIMRDLRWALEDDSAGEPQTAS
jgi:RNA polymerase sigma-B factor